MVVFLIGFMGSGKTTTGKKLAKKLGFDFLDLDTEIEKDQQSSINEIFNQKGESFFRAIEHQKLMDILPRQKLVISCGGGTPCFNNQMELMNKHGYTVYMRLNPEALYSRLIKSRESRPLISNLKDTELKAYIKTKLEEREQTYLMASIEVNGLSIKIQELADLILDTAAKSGV